MATAEERIKILKLIQEGKITAEEGSKLLAALSSSKRSQRKKVRTASARWFRVRVTDIKTGKAKVNINLPLKLVDAGVNIAAQFVPDMNLTNVQTAINSAIDDHLSGKIIDVIDEKDGEHVEIYIE